MRWFAFVVALGCTVLVAQPLRVELTGIAVMPAETFAAGPPSGAYRTGAGQPEFTSQPVQGFSSIRPAGRTPDDADWLALVDNGFGVRVNSPDSLLRLYRVRVNWARGMVAPQGPFIPLADPNHVMRFHIVRDDTRERLLTGGDLDPESFLRMPDGSLWIGDEFGPFLAHFASDGTLLAAPIELPGLRSPDFPDVAPPDAGQASTAKIRRSRGFEGLGASSGHRRLYAALEAGPISDPPSTTRIIEFDPAVGAWTGSWWSYPLDAADRGVTELIGLGEVFGARCENHFLAVERDNEQGEAAKWKRVFEVRLSPALSKAPMPLTVEKRLVADLLDIANPAGLGGFPTTFRFPYITTESVWPTDPQTLVLVNDNNYPASGGRGPMRDVTEFIRLRLPRELCSAP
ncbi:MAG: esterase-like activity of phytase family protein [Vicinamibacterales bacterium]